MPLLRVREPFDRTGWVYELKYDGFRALTFVERRKGRLVSRTGHHLRRFDALGACVAGELGAHEAVLDGEVVCLGPDGSPIFNALFFARGVPVFVAFDCLWLDGEDLRGQPLLLRKAALRSVLPRRSSTILYARHLRRYGSRLFALACERDLEGIVAKSAHAPYDVGASTWIKVKNVHYSQARDRHELFESRRRRA